MRNFHTANLDTFLDVEQGFITEPYEVAWAGEAIFFVRIDDASKNPKGFEAVVQISLDGLTWVDEGTRFEVLGNKGDYFARVSHFGGWLRLKGTLDPGERYLLSTYLVLKE